MRRPIFFKQPGILFISKGILFLIFIKMLDAGLGTILQHYYFKQESGLQYRTTQAIEKTKAELLIFGSSRANHHYYPDYFEKQFGLSYYNVGRDGCYLYYHYAILKGVLKRYHPKMIILDFVSQEFKSDQDAYDRLSVLLPYYKDHPEIRSIIKMKSRYEKLKLCSSIYPYNSMALTIFAGNSNFNKKRTEDFKGYVPLHGEWNEPLQTYHDPFGYKVDTTIISTYKQFIIDCKEADISLFIVCSPYFLKSASLGYSIHIAQRIAQTNHVPFFDFSQDSIFLSNSHLFEDDHHMNEKGAKIFSSIIIDSIRHYFEINQFKNEN